MGKKIGLIGLGKLGLPVATAMALRGADVTGYDLNPERMSYAPQPYRETGPDGDGVFDDWLAGFNPDGSANIPPASSLQRLSGRLHFGQLAEVVAHADILFVAVQTPHDARFEGTVPLRGAPVDFDYRHLREAVKAASLAKAVSMDEGIRSKRLPTVIISTVLPGTIEREIKPLLPPDMPLVYNPAFIAMGTTMRDFLDPEFVLLGVDDEEAAEQVGDFYQTLLPDVSIRGMSVPSAELAKVAYNTAISQKVVLANAVMEICHKTPGANCDEVTGAMKAAYRRVASGMYMDGGQGDGGGCHPRDGIAMMWLAKRLGLSHDPFGAAMRGREEQARWLCSLVADEKRLSPLLDVVIAGYAYKPGTNLTVGSAALLCADILEEEHDVTPVHRWDPHVNPAQKWKDAAGWGPRVVLVGCDHPEMVDALASLPFGSVVIDPFRKCRPTAGVRVIAVGVGLERGSVEVIDVEDEHIVREITAAVERGTARQHDVRAQESIQFFEGPGHD